MTSVLRKECSDAPEAPVQSRSQFYYSVYEALNSARGLIYGRLRNAQGACAMGKYWDRHPRYGVPYDVLDEIARVNDLRPGENKFQRWQRVRRYLRARMQAYGIDV